MAREPVCVWVCAGEKKSGKRHVTEGVGGGSLPAVLFTSRNEERERERIECIEDFRISSMAARVVEFLMA